MSALGQKPTYALQQAMSALHPIATAKADFRTRSCLLYPRKRTCAVRSGMSALGQKRTQCAAASSISLDGCVGAREQRTRHCEAQGFSSFEIDHKLIFDWSLDRKLTRLLALKDAIDIGRRKPK